MSLENMYVVSALGLKLFKSGSTGTVLGNLCRQPWSNKSSPPYYFTLLVAAWVLEYRAPQTKKAKCSPLTLKPETLKGTLVRSTNITFPTSLCQKPG